MTDINAIVTKLFSLRNRFGKEAATVKLQLLSSINIKNIKRKKTAQTMHAVLLFLRAYPDSKAVYKQACELKIQLKDHVQQNEGLQHKLYNSGITGTNICAAFGFEMVKWFRKTRPSEIRFNSFEAGDALVQSFISGVMSRAESEIFQDGNAEWKSWLKKMRKPGEDILDQLIAIFDSSNIRPDVKDELWNAIGICVEIDLTSPCCLPASLIKNFYHRSLLRKSVSKEPMLKPVAVKLNGAEAEQIIDCSRMILIRYLREIDPISFTSAKLVSYFHLPRGISIALMEMVPERRHPIDSYMGYTVFKNGLPVAYAGSWILFDSGRIGLNIFPDYRGGETRYIFEKVLELHAKVYHLRRFTADPYQIGKDNSDGIHSGAFWAYYNVGFRPIEKQQQQLATLEAAKIEAGNKYRTAPAVLKMLAESRLELLMQKNAVRFDATDMSRAYAAIITKKYKGNRQRAEKGAAKKLASILQIRHCQDDNMNFVLQSWAVFLLCREKEIKQNNSLKRMLKTLFNLKASGSEELYISGLQKAGVLQKLIEDLVEKYATDS